MLGLSYKSAWFMSHRIRLAMDRGSFNAKLDGVVEADETNVGSKAKGARGRSTKKKTPVFTLDQRGGDVRSRVVERVTAKSLKGAIREDVDPEARVMTDGFSSYHGLDKEFAEHGVINHLEGIYAEGDIHTNTVESYFSLLKRGIIGAFHHVSKQHLHR